MGPTIIFDKSTLQSISIDESVFLQQFFLTNLTPLFYVETLGDLDLEKHKSGKPIIDVISELSAKVPSTGIFPNVHHARLLVGNLIGLPVEMDGRTIRDGGQEKIDPEGNIGIHYSESPEEIALRRWNKKEYSEIEQLFSGEWRRTLSNISFDIVLAIVKNIAPINKEFKNPSQIKDFVDKYVKSNEKELLYLAFELLGLPEKYYHQAQKRWNQSSTLSFEEFAPYTAFALKVDLFFYLNMLKGFESKERSSHIVDLSYLYYLPFCNVFVSNDKLHKRIAPFFIRKNQIFVDGRDFKKGLGELDKYYTPFIDEIAEKGMMGFASQPPTDLNNKITEIWDGIFPNWRKSTSNKKIISPKPEEDKRLVEYLQKVQKESKALPHSTPSDEVHHVIMTHKVKVQKGKWRILPKGIENKTNESLQQVD